MKPVIPGLPSAPEEVLALHPRVLAHLGDAVYETLVREAAIVACSAQRADALHRFTTQRARGVFQAELLTQLSEWLTDEEREVVRRGRNVPLSSSRRKDQALHHQATAFETLVGFLYLARPERLQALWAEILPRLQDADARRAIAPPEERPAPLAPLSPTVEG